LPAPAPAPSAAPSPAPLPPGRDAPWLKTLVFVLVALLALALIAAGRLVRSLENMVRAAAGGLAGLTPGGARAV
jgi:hypothetical protein